MVDYFHPPRIKLIYITLGSLQFVIAGKQDIATKLSSVPTVNVDLLNTSGVRTDLNTAFLKIEITMTLKLFFDRSSLPYKKYL